MQEFFGRFLSGAWRDDPAGMKILYSLAVIAVLALTRLALHRFVWKKTGEAQTRYLALKISANAIAGIGLIALSLIWIRDFRQVGTYLGLLSAGIAIALKELISDVAGWVFILARRPFVTGDRVQIGELSGDVVDIRVFQFTVLEIGNWVKADQSTGRVVHVPNGAVFTQTLANYTRGFEYIWNEVTVTVTFESDWKKAKAILLSVAEARSANREGEAQERIREASKRYFIVYSNLTPTVYTKIEESGVSLTARYLCLPRKRRDTENAINEDILEAFSREPGIDFAYPTRRIVPERQ